MVRWVIGASVIKTTRGCGRLISELFNVFCDLRLAISFRLQHVIRALHMDRSDGVDLILETLRQLMVMEG